MKNLLQKLQDLLKRLISGFLTGMVYCYSGLKSLESIGMGHIKEKLYLPEYISINATFMKDGSQVLNYSSFRLCSCYNRRKCKIENRDNKMILKNQLR